VKGATTSYIQEERRRAGAVPKIKAEIRPFDVDFGLGPGLGSFENCSSPSAGALLLDSGYITSGSWTSDILQPYLGQLSAVIPARTALLDYASDRLYLRTAARYGDVNGLAWVEAEWGVQTILEAYFQVKIVFSDFIRAWAVDDAGDADGFTAYAIDQGLDDYLSYAVDPEFPGRLTDIKLSGLVEIDEASIIDCQHIISTRPAFFHDIHGFHHTLTIDNRGRQWIPGHQNFLMADGLWYGKELHLYNGFELPTGEIDWVLQYVGRIRDIREITNSFTGLHQAKISSYLAIHEALLQEVGVPHADGTRAPFLAGYYKARAELKESTAPYMGAVNKTGTGSAVLHTLGSPNNTEDVEFIVEAETTGEISTATFRWSMDGGSSWEKAGIVSMSSIKPFHLRDGVYIYFEPGAGDDLVAGDRFTFTSYARRTTYVLAGGPFLDITNVYFNGVEIFGADVSLSGEVTLTGHSGFVDARVVKSETSNPVDIIREVLEAVGVDDKIDEVSFSNARQAIADYQVGVRFEALPAWKAIQEICRTCLIYFWMDAGRVYLSAYTGEG